MINTTGNITPLDKAIAAVGGYQNVLAKKVGVSAQAITSIKKRGGNLPVKKMNDYIIATGLSKEELYPEIFNI